MKPYVHDVGMPVPRDSGKARRLHSYKSISCSLKDTLYFPPPPTPPDEPIPPLDPVPPDEPALPGVLVPPVEPLFPDAHPVPVSLPPVVPIPGLVLLESGALPDPPLVASPPFPGLVISGPPCPIAPPEPPEVPLPNWACNVPPVKKTIPPTIINAHV